MIRTTRLAVFALLTVAFCACRAGAYPKPNPFPITWELKFEHSKPKRIVVKPAGAKTDEAYWYMTFTVTNTSRDDQKFHPRVELLGEDGSPRSFSRPSRSARRTPTSNR
jgi:hypothetical protein